MLFKLNDKSKVPTVEPPKIEVQPNAVQCYSGIKYRELHLLELTASCSIDLYTKGKLHLRQVISYCLSSALWQSNHRRALYMSTWSISETALLSLSVHKKRGDIEQLTMLTDYRLVKRKPKVYQLLRSVMDKHGAIRNHAKICVLDGEQPIVITASANYTDNPSNEFITIRQNQSLADFYRENICADIVKGGEKSKVELRKSDKTFFFKQ